MMRKIKTLQTLRFIAFSMIFWQHTQPYHFMNLYYSASWGVSFFIVLSGFLNGYKYCNSYADYSYGDIKNFIVNKVKKFYPLHIVTLILTIPFSGVFLYAAQHDFRNIIRWSKSLICNILLIQDYFTNGYFSFNGVSWFLSLMVFLIIITIPLISMISKIMKSKNGIIKLLFCIIAMIAIDYIYVLYAKNHSLKLEFWLYIFPPSRIPEYVCGLIIGFIIGKKDYTISMKYFTLFEIIPLTTLGIIIKYFPAIEWLDRGFIWLIPNIMLITIFAFEKGIISKLFSNKLLVYLGDISFETFLIHQIVITYFVMIVSGGNLSGLTKFAAEAFILMETIIIGGYIHSSAKRNALL